MTTPEPSRPEASLRRLRFDLDLREGESIPGALCRGAASHGLYSVAPVLASAGIAPRCAGSVQLLAPEDARRLAYVIKGSPDVLASGVGRRSHDPGGPVKTCLAFGDLVLPNAHFAFRRRRIGPASFQKDGYHRSAWLNALLPYCPESLERLVDTCGLCGASLRWAQTLGVANCETCARPVPPSSEAPLADDLSADYRLFADLVSIVPAVRRSAHDQLPPRLAQVAPGDLVRLALRLGILVHGEALTIARETSLTRAEPRLLAGIVSSGAGMLRNWPDGLRGWAVGQAAARREDADAYNRLRHDLRWVGEHVPGVDGARDLSTELFPDLDRPINYSFAASDDYYLVSQAEHVLGVSNAKVERLLAADLLPCERLPTRRTKVRVRLEGSPVRSLGDALRGCVATSACQPVLELPIYAVEQLVCLRILERETHPGVLLLHDQARVRSASIASLVDRLRAAASSARRPREATALNVTASFIGGRLKPWGAIYSALLAGELPFWLVGDGVTTRDIHVLGSALERFESEIFDEEAWTSFPFESTMHTIDAAELLNLTPPIVERIRDAGFLSFMRQGKSRRSPKAEVLDLAARHASNIELAAVAGVACARLATILGRAGLVQTNGLWPRDALEIAGVPRL